MFWLYQTKGWIWLQILKGLNKNRFLFLGPLLGFDGFSQPDMTHIFSCNLTPQNT